MADLLDFAITRIANASLNVPRWTVEGRIVSSKNQQNVLQDFTGVNAVTFPVILGQLTAAEQDEFVAMSIHWLLAKRFPGAFG
jgi:hypothetical protein